MTRAEITEITEADRCWLARAILLAAENADVAAEQTPAGGPFGAVIARGGQFVAESGNRVLENCDPTAHAEVEAIRAACREGGRVHLEGCALYASSEPCPMCLAAAYWARIERIVYANSRAEAEAIGFDDAGIYRELALPESQRSIITLRLCVPGAAEPLRRWQAQGRVIY